MNDRHRAVRMSQSGLIWRSMYGSKVRVADAPDERSPTFSMCGRNAEALPYAKRPAQTVERYATPTTHSSILPAPFPRP